MNALCFNFCKNDLTFRFKDSFTWVWDFLESTKMRKRFKANRSILFKYFLKYYLGRVKRISYLSPMQWENVLKQTDRYCSNIFLNITWAASSEFRTYRLCEQRRFRRACASAQSRQNLRCSLIQAVSQEEPSDRKPDPWSLWMAGHAQLKFVITECSKTQIRLMRPKYYLVLYFS